MALQYKINKTDYDALADALKNEYKPGTGDTYVLDLTGVDMRGAEKYEAERDKRRAAEKRTREVEGELSDMKDNDDRPALIDAHKREMGKVTKERDDFRDRFTGYVRTKELDTAAQSIAEKASPKHAKLLLPHVRAMLDLDLTDPLAPKVVVLDGGKPSAKTFDDVHKEILANKDFADIVVTSQATGGAASRPGGTAPRGYPAGVGNSHPSGGTQPLLRDMSVAEHKARIEARGGPMKREPAQQQ